MPKHIEAYCLHCKKKTTIASPKQCNARVYGTCSVCGKKVSTLRLKSCTPKPYTGSGKTRASIKKSKKRKSFWDRLRARDDYEFDE